MQSTRACQVSTLCPLDPRDQEPEPQKLAPLLQIVFFLRSLSQDLHISLPLLVVARGPLFNSLLSCKAETPSSTPSPRQKQALLYLAHNLLLQICCCYPASNPRGPKPHHLASDTGLRSPKRSDRPTRLRLRKEDEWKRKRRKKRRNENEPRAFGRIGSFSPLQFCVWVRLLSWHRQAELRASATTILWCPISCNHLFFTSFTTLAMPSASQSSQQSFTMSQQSQTGRAASFNRSYNGGVDGPQIYSVCIPALCQRQRSACALVAIESHRKAID